MYALVARRGSRKRASLALHLESLAGMPLNRQLTDNQQTTMGERQGIAQKGVCAIDARKTAARNGESAAKTRVRAPGLSTDQCEHAFV